MDNNDFMRRLRYALQIDDAQAARLIALGGGRATHDETAAWRLKEGDANYLACTDSIVDTLLAGLIVDRRSSDEPVRKSDGKVVGARPDTVGAESMALASNAINNLRFKQLRIALAMRSDDVEATLKAGGSGLSSSEVAALFRKPGARNFRRCGDQTLRHFLVGLTKTRDDQDPEVTDAAPGDDKASMPAAARSPWPTKR